MFFLVFSRLVCFHVELLVANLKSSAFRDIHPCSSPFFSQVPRCVHRLLLFSFATDLQHSTCYSWPGSQISALTRSTGRTLIVTPSAASYANSLASHEGPSLTEVDLCKFINFTLHCSIVTWCELLQCCSLLSQMHSTPSDEFHHFPTDDDSDDVLLWRLPSLTLMILMYSVTFWICITIF